MKAKLKASLEITLRDIMDVVEATMPDFKKDVTKSRRTKNLTASMKYGKPIKLNKSAPVGLKNNLQLLMDCETFS